MSSPILIKSGKISDYLEKIISHIKDRDSGCVVVEKDRPLEQVEELQESSSATRQPITFYGTGKHSIKTASLVEMLKRKGYTPKLEIFVDDKDGTSGLRCFV